MNWPAVSVVTGTVHLICDHNWRLAEIRPIFNQYRTNMLGREAIFYCSRCLDWRTQRVPEPEDG